MQVYFHQYVTYKLLSGVKAILTNFTSSAAAYIWSFFPILLKVIYC